MSVAKHFKTERQATELSACSSGGRVCWLIAALCLVAYFVLWVAVAVADGGPLAFDEAIYQAISVDLRSEWLTLVMTNITVLGTAVPMTAMIVVLIAFTPHRREGWYCAVSAILVRLLNELLKALAARPRPDESLWLVNETGLSFPSGHTMNAVALFGLFAWFVWRSDHPRWLRILLCAIFVLVAALVGVSRVYLGVHYASDVLAGVCVSVAWLVIYTRCICYIEAR